MCVQSEIVGGAAGAQDQGAGVAQRAQSAAERVVLLGRTLAADRYLHRGHVGTREQQRQRNPRAVIETAPRLGHGRQACGAQSSCDIARELRAAGRRITQAVQLVGEPAEIVDGLGLRRGRDLGRRGVVVCGNHDDRGRRRQARAERLEETPRRAIDDGEHRRTVRDEQRGHPSHVPLCPAIRRELRRRP